MVAARVHRYWARLRPGLFLAVVVPAGCVVVDEPLPVPEPVAAAPVAIPFGGGEASAQPHDAYYQSIVGQLQHAWLERDRARLAALLEAHDRSDAPDWAQERLAAFRRILRVMEFEDVVLDRGVLDLPEPLPALGEPLQLTVRLGPLSSFAVRLLGAGHPARSRFVLVLRIIDTDGFGARVENATTTVLDLPRTIDFAAGESVQVPVAVEMPAAGAILRRVGIEVFLMPGHVEMEGATLPNRRVRCARGELELLPRGHDRVAAQPLAALQAALALGDATHFAHVYLATREIARAGDPAARATAAGALIDRVRLGRDEQVRSALAALAVLEPEAARVNRDRGQWLQWWSARR